jgi:hypothetical protein
MSGLPRGKRRTHRRWRYVREVIDMFREARRFPAARYAEFLFLKIPDRCAMRRPVMETTTARTRIELFRSRRSQRRTKKFPASANGRSHANAASHTAFQGRTSFALLALQLYTRYLTGEILRGLNRVTRKNLSRTFPHDKIFCASMPPDHLLIFSLVRVTASDRSGGVLR